MTAYANSTRQGHRGCSDADGHSLEYAYTLYENNGNIVQQNASGSLTSSLLMAEDEIEVRVRADDLIRHPLQAHQTQSPSSMPKPTNLTIRINPAEAIP